MPNADVFAYLVAYGELLVGIALILGFLTRLSVLPGVAMNLAFLFAGTTSTNPQMLILGLALAGLGAGAGAYGLDRWVLPLLKEKAGPGAIRIAAVSAAAVCGLIVAWLAWITTDAEAWLGGALIAVLALIAFGTRQLGRQEQESR